MKLKEQAKHCMNKLVQEIVQSQSEDGAFRYCYESGLMTDAYMIIILRVLDRKEEVLIQQLVSRILSWQTKEGYWKLFADEIAGNLSTTVDAYHALLFSGYVNPNDPRMVKAADYIRSQGGISEASLLTKVMLAVNGHYHWPSKYRMIPLSFLLVPTSFPLNFFDFSSFARAHLVSVLIMANLNYQIQNKWTPDLSSLHLESEERDAVESERDLMKELKNWMETLLYLPDAIQKKAVDYAEKYMLDRIEVNGTLSSYASSTFLMIYALLALGYEKNSKPIAKAVEGLKSLIFQNKELIHVQNSSSTVWDTALLTYALQEAGLPATHNTIMQANDYLLKHQQTKYGDWVLKSTEAKPGGWGFSDINTFIPDVDDTTAALRAIDKLSDSEDAAIKAWNRGIQWVFALQNRDGGWPAFEKNTDLKWLTYLPINGAESAATDPSSADLTGRTLEFLGNTAGMTMENEQIAQAAEWLFQNQEEDGSWYGRWGICYLYGTWAAVTGLRAVGVSEGHPAIQKAVGWLLNVQNADGGWGESCESDFKGTFISLRKSTLSQTAWALDTLLTLKSLKNQRAIDRGIHFLTKNLFQEKSNLYRYPTGGGLPGEFYTYYHSYNKIWPLLALSHYIKRKIN